MEILEPICIRGCISLCLSVSSIRSGDWHLRMASMKLMAPIFTAFNHPTYQHLISHLTDVLYMPPSFLDMFVHGGFVVGISGTQWELLRHTKC